MIYYNTDIFAQEGLKGSDIPTNWDDFIKLAQQLTIKDSDGKVTRAGCAMNDYWQHEYLWQDLIYQQGGWMYKTRAPRRCGKRDPRLWLCSSSRTGITNRGLIALSCQQVYGGFCNDMAAMFMGSGWNTGFFLPEFPADGRAL